MEKLAELAHGPKDDEGAARLYGAACALRASVNSMIDPTDQPEYVRITTRIRALIGNDLYEAIWAESQAMPLEKLTMSVSLSLFHSTDQ